MSWAQNHLPEADGIAAAEERHLSTFQTCHKCGGELGWGQALVVRHDSLNDEARGIHRWEILCHRCKTDLARRLAPTLSSPAGDT